MSSQALEWSYRFRLALIHGAVLRSICQHANKDTSEATPARATIAEESGCSVRSVINAIGWLEQRGFIAIERSPGRRSHRYRVLLNGAPDAPFTKSEKRRIKKSTVQDVHRRTTPNGAGGSPLTGTESRRKKTPNGAGDSPSRDGAGSSESRSGTSRTTVPLNAEEFFQSLQQGDPETSEEDRR